MTIKPLIILPDPVLRQVSRPVETVDAALRALADDMLETMYDAPGIGLAAIQVAVPKRVLVIDLQEPAEEGGEPVRNPRVFVNPVLFDPSVATKVYNEGCLSIPDQYADVERPAAITVRWLDYDGKSHEERIDGLLATCLQHEMDHLEGILFIDHLSRLKKDMILKKIAKMQRDRARAA